MVRKPDFGHISSRGRFWGGILLGVGLFWLIWLLFFYHPVSSTSSQWAGAEATPSPLAVSGLHTASLTAAGITVNTISPPSTMSQAQALQLADQLEPDAAAGAHKKLLSSVSLTYLAASRGAKDLRAVPVWMICYQDIPQAQTTVALDTGTAHDLYVFLNPRTGSIVLTVWA
ncbi:hypothetical protein [Dictyobacter arantiisoli]|uniref:Uncharacterized protein n=1 Tax=Dictyobacter arantiisoli TaxID=2014874 RepID=A0A5A5TB87_9CHLR|nr:hypothetical protein [Dictyobacter arantiisoli]GCF08259.1 hypothetical protein KDI_18230 [Dictyobacter arantiisoli]